MAPRKLDAPPQRGAALPPPVGAWFGAQDAGGALLSSREVRHFLSAYSPHAWPQATRLALLIGVATLRAAHGDRPLSLEELQRALGAPRAARAPRRGAQRCSAKCSRKGV